MTIHTNSLIGHNHILHNWVFANSATRNAATYTATDVGKEAFQTDDSTFWRVISVTAGVATFREAAGTTVAPTWASVTSKPTTIGGFGITDFFSQVVSAFDQSAGGTVVITDTLITALNKIAGNIAAWRVPSGGTTGQVLSKVSGTANDVTWTTPANASISNRVSSISANSATPTVNADNFDVLDISGQTSTITSISVTGSAITKWQILIVSIKGAGAVTFTLGSGFEVSTISPPVSTIAGQPTDITCRYNSDTSKWRVVGVA